MGLQIFGAILGAIIYAVIAYVVFWFFDVDFLTNLCCVTPVVFGLLSLAVSKIM
jgi:hypothetical protein